MTDDQQRRVFGVLKGSLDQALGSVPGPVVPAGRPVGGKSHTQAQDTARGLRNWLRRNPNADPKDRLVARSLHDELVDALGAAP